MLLAESFWNALFSASQGWVPPQRVTLPSEREFTKANALLKFAGVRATNSPFFQLRWLRYPGELKACKLTLALAGSEFNRLRNSLCSDSIRVTKQFRRVRKYLRPLKKIRLVLLRVLLHVAWRLPVCCLLPASWCMMLAGMAVL